MSNSEKIVANLTTSHSRRQVLYEMSTKQFHKLEYPFTNKRPNEDWFLFKLDSFVPTPTLSVDKDCVDLFYGGLFTLKQDNKNVGFLVNMPKMEHRIQSDLLISAPKSTQVEDLSDSAEVFLTTNALSVFVLDGTAQFIAAYDRSVLAKLT
jgi:hypothetical protein